MYSKATLIVFSILFSDWSFSQTLNENILASTVLITYNHHGFENYGSGFVIFKEVDRKTHKGYHYLMTNLHVLKEADKVIKLRFFRSNYADNNAKMELVVKFKDSDGNYLPGVRMNKDKEDLVALDVTTDFNDNQIEGHSLPYDLLATRDTLKKYSISVGDEVFMVGYPDEIYDKKSYSPIFRYGIIATLPTENYSFNEKLQNKYGFPISIPGFLIDANVFSGSSGSLVILKQQIGNITNGNINFGSSKPFILGIVDKSIPVDDSSVSNIKRIGLGIVYSAEAIKSTIDFGYRIAE